MQNPIENISVIIPVKDSSQKLESTLKSIFKTCLSDYKSKEVIVVNDGNNADINKLIATKYSHRVTLVSTIKSKGSYHARNKGIKNANGDYLIFFDVPLKLEPGWFPQIKKAFDDGYDYIVGNIKVDPDDCNTLAKKMYAVTSFPVKSYFNNQNFGPTAFLAVKKKVFDEIGLFDTLYSGGDMVFGQRVYKEGYSMKFLKAAVACHPSRNLKQQFWKKVRVYSGNYRLYIDEPEERSNPVHFRSFFSCLTAIPANLINYQRNKMYQSGLFNYSEYIIAVCMFWGVEFSSRLYVLINKKKRLNT